jgi:predicted Fe-Mo cluster-binding NifX family protein
MKVAIPSTQPTEKAFMEARFGRAPYFMVYDTDAGSWESIENKTNLNASQGAGIQTAEMLVKNGVGAVLAGHCGPKAFRVLQSAGIMVFMDITGSVEEALDTYQNNNPVAAENANVNGHW